jgi:undecaprenyl-diphosphatase
VDESSITKRPIPPRGIPLKSFLAFLLSLVVVISALLVLAQTDYQTILFVRSIEYPLLKQMGNLGNQIGHGVTLVTVSLGLLVVGYGFKRSEWRQAGWDTLGAHVVVGGLTQIPKHLIGRPRPRLTHQDPFQFGPSLTGGLDAFPSGHTSATFAVVTVLAKYFPRWSGVGYGLALFVGISRVGRESHFPTDVLAGAFLGYILGYIWSRSLKNWRQSLLEAFPKAVPLLVVSVSIYWVMVHRDISLQGIPAMVNSGILLAILGIVIRFFRVRQGLKAHCKSSSPEFIGTFCILSGMAFFTESWILVGLSGLSMVTWIVHKDLWGWPILIDPNLHQNNSVEAGRMREGFPVWPWVKEGLVGVAVMLSLVVLQGIKGGLPLI